MRAERLECYQPTSLLDEDFGRGGARRELSSNISSLGDDSMDMDEVQGECPE